MSLIHRSILINSGSAVCNKYGKWLVKFLMICKTAVESVQNMDLQFGKLSSLLTSCSRWIDTTAAVSSSLGTDTDLIGATRALFKANAT